MKIFHLSSEYPDQEVHGLGRAVEGVSVAQAKRGDEVHVVTNSDGGRTGSVMRRGVHVHRVWFPPPPCTPDSAATVTQYNVQLMERGAPLIRKIRPDVLNLHDWLTVPGGLPLARVYRLPVVFTVHDTAIGKQANRLEPSDVYTANLEAWGMQVADRVICCSRAVEHEMIARYDAPSERIRIVPCGVDAQAFEITASPAHLAAFRSVFAASDEPIVLYLGRLDPEKGLDVLINAIPRVLAGSPRARFIVIGKGQLGESLAHHVQQAGLAKSVRFTGYVAGEPLALLLHSADLLVIPSTYEPFGLVALEAMASRLPVVVPDSTGLAEIVTDGVDGRMFRTRDAGDLAARIGELLADEPQRRRLRDCGYSTATSRYTWARVAELTQEVYAEAIDHAAGPRHVARPVTLDLPSAPPASTRRREPSGAPTWVVLLAPESLEFTRRLLDGFDEPKHPPCRVLAVDTKCDRAVTAFLNDSVDSKRIARLVRDAPGTLPGRSASAALGQALKLLADEYVETLVWIEGPVDLPAGWLDAALAVLHGLDSRTPAVALGPDHGIAPPLEARSIAGHGIHLAAWTNRPMWLVRRAFFGMFGTPPTGAQALPLVGEGGYYTRVMRDAGCRVALLAHRSGAPHPADVGGVA